MHMCVLVHTEATSDCLYALSYLGGPILLFFFLALYKRPSSVFSSVLGIVLFSSSSQWRMTFLCGILFLRCWGTNVGSCACYVSTSHWTIAPVPLDLYFSIANCI